jgi:hypothetical protein
MKLGLFKSGLMIVGICLVGVPKGMCAQPHFVRALNLPLVSVEFTPDTPHVGDVVSAIVQLETDFSSPDPVRVVLKARLDGSQSIGLTKISSEIWTAQVGSFSSVGDHSFSVDVLLEDSSDTDAIRNAISGVEADIANLENAIASEQDPGQLAEYQAQLVQAQQQHADLLNQLASEQTLVGTDSFNFQVVPEFFATENGWFDWSAFGRSLNLL